ncbi:nucleolar protein 9 [Alosa sapidissima]|uniref:nucleolar protein 9 n=1 Tax=Alosa sapidissima TaxID=34773 RepID=UPI001C094129|nr:nucleolar protein 9 [Alosa sapidissima]XP_041949362.1 nucleolar protein 9 [Alosa sapidissima]
MVEKMEESPKKQPKEGSKNKWSGHGEKRKSDSGPGGGGRKRLDAQTVGYFRRVSDLLSEGFNGDEEKVLFVDNVLREMEGQATMVAMDMTGSVTLQKLLSFASVAQVGHVLSLLAGEAGAGFKAVSCDRCGGHVMESALRQMSRWTDNSPSEQEEPATTDGDDNKEADDCGMLEEQVLSICNVVRENLLEFIRNTHGSHVVRTLVHVLAGCVGPARTDSRPGGKHKHGTPITLTDFEAPVSFWYELKNLSACLLENVNVCVTDCNASPVLQTMLTVCHRKRPKLLKQINKSIMEYLTGINSAPGVSPLIVFFKDQTSSRLLETVIQFSHKALLRDLYKDHLKTKLVDLALHHIANFPIQKFIVASAELKVFTKVFNEIVEGLEAIMAAGHMGVVVQLAKSCVEREETQGPMLQNLLQAFHCAEPAPRHAASLPLFLSLYTYELCYPTPEEETAGDAPPPQRPLEAICYHGSCLVQSLAKFKDRSLLMNSLHSLSPAELQGLGSHQLGSHALQALVTTCSDKGKGKILRKMEGTFVQLACSRYGSRLLEAVWNSATVSQRQSIAQELVPSESQLRSDQFGRHIWPKFGLTHFGKRKAHWMEIQTGESKKRKMFSDILE